MITRVLVLLGLAAIMPAVLVLATDDDVFRTDWQLAEQPSGDTLVIEVAVGNSCKSLERLDVAETELSVTIAAVVRDHDDGHGCDDLLQMERREVRLREPLGDRELLGCDAPPELIDTHGDCRAVE